MGKYYQAAADDGGGAPAGGQSPAPQGEAAAPQNLIDAAKPAAAADGSASAPAPAAAASAEWFWSDGVKGADKPPEWFDGKKYKTVAEQAKAYPELAKKFGEATAKLKGFAGAPEQYELTMPDDLKDQLEWRADDPMLAEFQAFAKESGMSQATFGRCLEMLAKYEYSNVNPDWAKEKAALGERADERLKGFTDWYSASMDEESASLIKIALGVNPTPSDIFKALEAVHSAGRQPAINKPGDDVASALTLADVDRMQADPRFASDPAYRADVRAKRAQVVGTGDHKVIVGGAKR